MNIMDGMDAARFKSGNPDYKASKNDKEENEIMKHLNDSTSPHTMQAQMNQQPPQLPEK